MLLNRRRLGVLAGCGLLGVRQAEAQTLPGPSLRCRVIRKGHDIGTADYQFEQQADALTVRIAVDIHIKLGFVTLFSYVHRNVEHWQGGRLMDFTSSTNDNGTPNFATARRQANGIAVTGSRTAAYTAPDDAIGSSYWSALTLTAPLINTQNGKLLALSIRDAGASAALLADGKTVPATEYQVSGDMHLNLWYDAARQWAALQYYARDGSVLIYEKT